MVEESFDNIFNRIKIKNLVVDILGRNIFYPFPLSFSKMIELDFNIKKSSVSFAITTVTNAG